MSARTVCAQIVDGPPEKLCWMLTDQYVGRTFYQVRVLDLASGRREAMSCWYADEHFARTEFARHTMYWPNDSAMAMVP